MKRLLTCYIFILLFSKLFAETIFVPNFHEKYFLPKIEYETSSDGFYYKKNKNMDFVKTDKTFTAHKKISKLNHLGFDCVKTEDGLYIDNSDIKIKGSDFFEKYILYSETENKNYSVGELKRSHSSAWIPIWYFDALKENTLEIIEEAEPNRFKVYDGIIGEEGFASWRKTSPFLSSLYITNCSMFFFATSWNEDILFLFENITKKEQNIYEVKAYPNIQAKNKYLFWSTNIENFPELKDGAPVYFRFLINGNKMQIYNSVNNKIILELILMPEEWIFKYEKLIYDSENNSNVDYDSIGIPPEYYDLKIAKIVKLEEILSVSDNLRLRSGEETSSSVVTTMSEGTKVKILELGKAETIDGINSNWVKVEVQAGAKDRDGKPIKAGTVGWCYGGYLE